jgi:O6-methylguanine-DNA--protein-cysteine methyltransferase
MGQVPVKVAGPVAVNDFIIPSGNNDGFAIAVHPENMKTLDYGKILGVAWEAAEDLPINIVNVAVGLNSNDLAKRVQILNEKVEQIEAYLSGKNSTLLTKSIQENKTSFTKKMSDVEFDQFVDQNANQINESYRNARLELQSKNFDFNSIPGLSRLFDNPIEEIKRLRRDPTYTTQWGMIDQKIPSKK